HQPPLPTFGHLLPLGEGAAQRRMRGGQGLGQSHPSPGLRPPSPGGRGTKSLLPPGEGAAQRRMRGVRASASPTPHPAFGHPLPAGEGQNPFSRREKVPRSGG